MYYYFRRAKSSQGLDFSWAPQIAENDPTGLNIGAFLTETRGRIMIRENVWGRSARMYPCLGTKPSTITEICFARAVPGSTLGNKDLELTNVHSFDL